MIVQKDVPIARIYSPYKEASSQFLKQQWVRRVCDRMLSFLKKNAQD